MWALCAVHAADPGAAVSGGAAEPVHGRVRQLPLRGVPLHRLALLRRVPHRPLPDEDHHDNLPPRTQHTRTRVSIYLVAHACYVITIT